MEWLRGPTRSISGAGPSRTTLVLIACAALVAASFFVDRAWADTGPASDAGTSAQTAEVDARTDAGPSGASTNDTDDSPRSDASTDSANAENASDETAAEEGGETHSLGSIKEGQETGLFLRLLSLFGILVLVGVAFAMSTNRSEVDWKLVGWGVGLQLAFAGMIFLDPWGQQAILLALFLVWGASSDALDTVSWAVVIVAGAALFNPWVQPTLAGMESGFLTLQGLAIFVAFFAAVAGFLYLRETDSTFVATGIGLQVLFILFLFVGLSVQGMFDFAGDAVTRLLRFTDAGSEFLFDFGNPTDGEWGQSARNFAFSILPTIIFFSSLMTILYYLGIMQMIVRAFALLMRRTMDISGAESLSASANIFVGQTEAPLVIKPYVEEMTTSELSVVMTGGFATVAGGVMAAYVGMLQGSFPDIAKHLLTASVLSAPAALVIAKIIYPETGEPETYGDVEIAFESEDANVIDAAARGASEGLDLALNVGAMLLAFLALIAMFNYLVGWPGMQWNLQTLEQLVAFYRDNGMPVPEGCGLDEVGNQAQVIRDCAAQMASAQGAPDPWVVPVVSLEKIFGYIFWPFALVMGVPIADCYHVGRLMGEKMVINEFVAYASLGQMLSPESGIELQQRSRIIATYALCGFANFGSIGIQLGGIGGIAPSRKHDLAKIALRAMIGGTLAAMMTGTIAGILV